MQDSRFFHLCLAYPWQANRLPAGFRRARRELSCRRRAADLGAAIAAGADAEGERARGTEAPRELALQRLRRDPVGDEDEARRAPGALSDAGKSLAAEPFEGSGDTRAGIAAALHRREIIAEPRADLADAVGDRREIRFGKAGQQTQQGEAAGLRRHRFGKGRKSLKRRDLGGAGKAAPLRIEDQDDTPLGREDRARDDRRRRILRRLAAIDKDTSGLDGADADAGARAALGQRRQRARRQAFAGECRHRRRYGEAELRAGAEPDMLGNRRRNTERQRAERGEAAFRQGVEYSLGTLRRWLAPACCGGARHREARADPVDGQAQAAEAPA